MAKILRVVEPFLVVNLGDVFEYSNEEKMYISKHNEEFYKADDTANDVKSSYTSEFKISVEYAKALVDEGYLEEATEVSDKSFVNIFDEIDSLLTKYKKGLETIEQDMADLPVCVKVERQTVLTNMITLLEHLKSLKK
jgi:hypothetical protein